MLISGELNLIYRGVRAGGSAAKRATRSVFAFCRPASAGSVDGYPTRTRRPVQVSPVKDTWCAGRVSARCAYGAVYRPCQGSVACRWGPRRTGFGRKRALVAGVSGNRPMGVPAPSAAWSVKRFFTAHLFLHSPEVSITWQRVARAGRVAAVAAVAL